MGLNDYIYGLKTERYIEQTTADEVIDAVIDRVDAKFTSGDPERYEAINKELKEKFDILAEVEL